MKDQSFRDWLLNQIESTLGKPVVPAPFILWCDSKRDWKELLQKTCGDAIELWAEESHELLLRHRFAKEERKPRVIWLPAKRSGLSYFRVFEGEAVIREISLLEAIREFGVEITRAQEEDVREDLRAYALAKLDEPLSKWKKITPDDLISAGAVLTVLADLGKSFDDRISADKRSLFIRRVTSGFGLPEPDFTDPDKWRIRAVARLLATDAALKLGDEGLPAAEWIIPPGNSRKRAMELLDQWQRDLHLLSKLEILVEKADALLNFEPGLEAKSFTLSEPLASYKGENILFREEINQINRFENFPELATYLGRKTESYEKHAKGFWGQWASRKVYWGVLAAFGRAAQIPGVPDPP